MIVEQWKDADDLQQLQKLEYTRQKSIHCKNEQETVAGGSGESLKGKELVKAIQTELNRIGCQTGSPDGVAGKKTQNALRGYRRSGGPNWARGFSQKLLEQLQSEDPRKCKAKVAKKKSRSKSNPLRKIKKIFKIN